MISREEHIKQVNRFHDLVEQIDNDIEKSNGDKLELLRKYFLLTSKIWPIVDDSIENIKNKLDVFDNMTF